MSFTNEFEMQVPSRISIEDVLAMQSPSRPSISQTSIAMTSTDAESQSSTRGFATGQQLTPAKERLYLAALFWVMVVCGWNDGSSGPLIPRMQVYYQIGYSIVALIFVAVCVGFFTAAVLNVWLDDTLGFGKVLLLGVACQMSAYAIMSIGAPFPVFCCAFALAGLGSGLVLSLASAFVTKLQTHQNLKMCIFQACYGIGALLAPLIGTQFAPSASKWHFFYLVSLGLATTSFAVVLAVFRLKPDSQLLPRIARPGQEVEPKDDSWQKMKDIMGLKAVHMLALYTFVYVGVEVTIGGWIVTYLQDVRGGSESAGYVSTGFWAGLTIGRICFIWLNNKVGERNVVFGYVMLALGLEMVVWFVPDLIGNAIAVSLVGLFLGPLFPIMLSVSSQAIPRHLFGGAICWVESLGQVGSAMFPFATGLLASTYGVKAFQPVVVSLLGSMLAAWGLVVWSTSKKVKGGK